MLLINDEAFSMVATLEMSRISEYQPNDGILTRLRVPVACEPSYQLVQHLPRFRGRTKEAHFISRMNNSRYIHRVHLILVWPFNPDTSIFGALPDIVGHRVVAHNRNCANRRASRRSSSDPNQQLSAYLKALECLGDR